ncbi:MAG: hypothetical protein J0L77_00990 [Alphaproteobacteria bacterium]|nr:hypothetical protein [Alphaproteobacteria bacterium]
MPEMTYALLLLTGRHARDRAKHAALTILKEGSCKSNATSAETVLTY